MSLSNEQLERLCNAVYIPDLLPCKKGMDLATKIGECPVPKTDLMTEAEWQVVMDDLMGDSDLKALTVEDYVDYPCGTNDDSCDTDEYPGFRAVCFCDAKSAYVVFRGTHGEHEWADNVEAMFQVESKYQVAAADYVRKIRKEIAAAPTELVVAGHSKGGNKAQYSFIMTDANRCFSLDGQGFSKEFLAIRAVEILDKAKYIESYAERRDFVNCLGYYIKKPIFMKGRRGESLGKEVPLGQPIWYFHAPDGLRDNYGGFGAKAGTAYISRVLNKLCVYILSKIEATNSSENNTEHKGSINALVSLATKQESVTEEELITYVSKIFVRGFELIQISPEFKVDVIRFAIFEKRVITATLYALMHKQAELSKQSILSLLETKVAEILLETENGLERIEQLMDFIDNQLMQEVTDNKDECLTSDDILGVDYSPNMEEFQRFFGNIHQTVKKYKVFPQ